MRRLIPASLVLFGALGFGSARSGAQAGSAQLRGARPVAFRHQGFRASFHQAPPFGSLAYPFFADLFTGDDIYSRGYPVASQPPVILMQASRDVASFPNSQKTPSAQPLMIELQNGRYVRVGGSEFDGEALPLAFGTGNAQSGASCLAKSSPGRANRPATANAAVAQRPALATARISPELPPATLVFRDGHSEEVRDYTIADGALYARGDYYAVGYWNKKIELSSLDLPQTLQANSRRGVKFVLPSSVNEVITRP